MVPKIFFINNLYGIFKSENFTITEKKFVFFRNLDQKE